MSRTGKRGNVSAINLSKDGFDTQFELSEDIGRQYVFFGNRHQYFRNIDIAYEVSTTNKSAIDSVINWIYGKGLDTASDDKTALNGITTLFTPKVLKLLARDYKKYNAAAFQVAYSKVGKKRRVVKIKHHPVYKLAKGKKNKDDEVTHYYHSPNWEHSRTKAKKIPAFGTSNSLLEIYYIDGINISDDQYYGKVDYHPVLKYAANEGAIATFHNANIENGFTPGLLVNFNNGIPETDELQYEIEQDVINKWSGPAKAGKIIISFNDSNENAPTIETVANPDLDRQYEFTSKESESKILIGHKILSPLLMGINVKSGFSSNADEMKTAYQLMLSTVIKQYQLAIIEAIEEVSKVNNIQDKNLFFEPLIPLSFFDKDVQEKIIDDKGVGNDETIKDEV